MLGDPGAKPFETTHKPICSERDEPKATQIGSPDDLENDRDIISKFCYSIAQLIMKLILKDHWDRM